MMAALGASSCSSPNCLAAKSDAGGVAARPAETGDQARSDRIETSREDDRDRRTCGLDSRHRNAVGNDNGRLSAHEFCCHLKNPVIPIIGPAILDGDVLALDESGLVQTMSERTDKGLGAGRRRGAEETDHRHRGLLRAHSERPRRRGAADKRDELAPF